MSVNQGRYDDKRSADKDPLLTAAASSSVSWSALDQSPPGSPFQHHHPTIPPPAADAKTQLWKGRCLKNVAFIICVTLTTTWCGVKSVTDFLT